MPAAAAERVLRAFLCAPAEVCCLETLTMENEWWKCVDGKRFWWKITGAD
jgi:hypothetical protein